MDVNILVLIFYVMFAGLPKQKLNQTLLNFTADVIYCNTQPNNDSKSTFNKYAVGKLVTSLRSEFERKRYASLVLDFCRM